MSIAVTAEPRVQGVSVTDEAITAHLLVGRTISVPLVWSWRLAEATPEQRQRFEIIGRDPAGERDMRLFPAIAEHNFFPGKLRESQTVVPCQVVGIPRRGIFFHVTRTRPESELSQHKTPGD